MQNKFKSVALLAAVMLVAAGCASKKEAPPKASIEERPTSTAPSGSGTDRDTVVPLSADESAGDVAGAPTDREIFFDLDQYTIKPEYQKVVQVTANFLKGRPGVKVIIQGNTDERGSREYNLSLGQKRAEAVRKALGVLGIADDRVEAVSFGEEKPRAECANESCWSKNRRADIVYLAR